jgi:cell division protein FtsQ
LFGVREVTVQGQHRTHSTAVRQAAQVPLDEPLVRIDVQAIERRVEALPTVQRAQVARIWPHTVRISVTEREPIAVVRHGSQRRYISVDGVDFAPASEQTRLPVIDLDVAVAPRDRVTTALAVVEQLPRSVKSRLGAIEVYAPTDVRLTLRGGAVVYWGSAARTVDKAAVLAALIALHPRALTYDVSAPDAPTVRP